MSKKRKDAPYDEIDINNLKFYYGVPNLNLSSLSEKSKPNDILESSKHSGLDYMILTDNNTHLNSTIDDKGDTISKWQSIQKSITKFNKKNDDFIALHGFEVSDSPLGNLTIINTTSYFNGSITNLKALMLWLLQDENSFVTLTNPENMNNKIQYNELINKFINTTEIVNMTEKNKYSQYEKDYFSLLDSGWKLGAISSQENKVNFNDSIPLTGIVCNELNKKSIINAFKNKHTFSTQSKSLKFFFSINSVFMGSELEESDNLDFYIYAEDEVRKIISLQIISSGGKIVNEMNDINLHRIKYIFKKDKSANENWYIIKLFFIDKKIAMSSPIFINKNTSS